jgi:ribonuclease E
MTSKILINAVDPEEVRLAIVKDSRLEEFHIENASKEILHSNIYKGVITRVEPSLQAVFVDFGAERHGFLQKQEIHSDYYQDPPTNGRSIQHIVKRGQELMVQVTKDPIMKKGAMLTTFISLPGRYAVLMPGSSNRGISRKIEDEAERNRLKEIVNNLNLPEGFGIIIRTAGMGCTKTNLTKDVRYLLRLWKNITSQAVKAHAPATLYKDRNLAVRSIRDHFSRRTSKKYLSTMSLFTRRSKALSSLFHPNRPKSSNFTNRTNRFLPAFNWKTKLRPFSTTALH